MDNSQKYKIAELLMRLLEGDADDNQIAFLKEWLSREESALEYYWDFIKDYTALKIKYESDVDSEVKLFEQNDYEKGVWAALADVEKTAPGIHIEKLSERSVEPVWIQTVRPERKISRFTVYTLIFSTAAMLLLAVVILFSPVRPAAVAALTDSINAEWINTEEIPAKEDVLRPGALTLARGLAEITFNDGAVVVVEAPAVIELESPQSMFVISGRISAVVSAYATGFTVNTPSASIVDLGTEFGVSVEENGSCNFNMFKGKASLIAGQKGQVRTSQIVNVNEARSVDFMTGTIKDIKLEEKSFVRHIDSDKGLIWCGQNLDLADIVGGGNGFGTGLYGSDIDLGTGELYVRSESDMRYTDNKYHPCDELPFVDGVFVPDGGAGPVQVTSQGHLWKDCPDTTGIFYEGIYTGIQTLVPPRHGFVLDGQRYGTSEHSAIATHVNAGVTFDIGALRSRLSALKIIRFEALCGVSREAGDVHLGNVSDFYVLVDGEKRFEAKGLGVYSRPRKVSVELSEEDRFLTLVSTDGDLASSSDWSFYAEPRLVLE